MAQFAVIQMWHCSSFSAISEDPLQFSTFHARSLDSAVLKSQLSLSTVIIAESEEALGSWQVCCNYMQKSTMQYIVTYSFKMHGRTYACYLTHKHACAHARTTHTHRYPKFIEWFTYWSKSLWNNTAVIEWTVDCPSSVSSCWSKTVSLLECETNVYRIMLLQLRWLLN